MSNKISNEISGDLANIVKNAKQKGFKSYKTKTSWGPSEIIVEFKFSK